MRIQFVFYFLVIYLASIFSHVVAANQKAELLDKVVALVGDDVVLMSEVDRRVSTVISQFKQNQQSLPPLEQLNKQVKERLILSLSHYNSKSLNVLVSE
jgi:peptidyl-prolyl cis-trans isomerase SurA